MTRYWTWRQKESLPRRWTIEKEGGDQEVKQIGEYEIEQDNLEENVHEKEKIEHENISEGL